MSPRALALGPCFVLLSLACAPPTAPPPRAQNVILVLVDTLRADHLSTAGYPRATSPYLTRLAAESVWFEQARSQAPCTFPSVNALLTGRPAQDFFGQPDGAMGIPPGAKSLAELLAAEGFSTAAVSASPIVRKSPSRFNPGGGFDRGFARFHEDCLWSSADCVVEAAQQELAALPEPFFLYVHFMDPHGPYRPPGAWPRQFVRDDPTLPEDIRQGDPNRLARALAASPATELAPREISALLDRYDEEIAYFDRQFEGWVESLRVGGLLDRTALVLVADHGEAFLEHGQLKHCQSLFDEEIRTPLLVRAAGVTPGRVATAVSNADVFPTVMALLGRDPAPFEPAGRSLLPALTGHEPPPAPTFAAWGPWRSVTLGPHKLIHHLADGHYQLFNLVLDPVERVDLTAREPERFRELKRALTAWIIEHEGHGSRDRSLAAGEAATERLRSLGYLQ